MTPAERATLEHRAEVRRMRNQSLRLTRGQVAAYASACLVALLALAVLAGCATTAAPHDYDDVRPMRDDFNAMGGYVPACGELPPLVGDDC